jgi:hypothetical protein
MLKTIFCLAYIFGAAIIAERFFKRNGAEKPKNEEPECRDSYSELSERISTLNSMKESIDTINNMIADIMSCAPGEVHKTIIVKIPDSSREYHFLINGEDAPSELFLEILEGERECVSTSLRKEIRKIS